MTRALPLLLLPLLGLLTPLTGFASDPRQSAAELDPDVQMALTIVNNYRTLRTSCTDLEGQARMDCFYRLRIGRWDYDAAREILAAHGVRVEASEMVAQRN